MRRECVLDLPDVGQSSSEEHSCSSQEAIALCHDGEESERDQVQFRPPQLQPGARRAEAKYPA